MQKFTPLLLILLLLIVTGCSDNKTPNPNEDNLIEQLQQNNALLEKYGQQQDEISYPFSQAYLTKRHELYQQLKNQGVNYYSADQLDYLIIEERFAERFFMWPPYAAVISNWLTLRERNAELSVAETEQVELTQWISLAQKTLMQRYDEKLILDKIHLHRLQYEIKQSISQLKRAFINPTAVNVALIQSLEGFADYLSNYRARNSLALSQQPNGASWYQAKLNYYGNTVKSPAQWFNATTQTLSALGITALPKGTLPAKIFHDDRLLNNWFLEVFPITSRSKGLDWRHSYVDIVSTLSQSEQSKVTPQLHFVAAVLAQVDIGIHYQVWTQQHARNVLQTLLGLDSVSADKIIEYTVLYPGVLLSPFALNSSVTF